MSASRYALAVSAMLAASLALAWPWLDRSLGPEAQPAAAFGGALAATNTAVGYALVRWSLSRPTNVFLAAVLGGMVGRLGLMLAAIVTGVLVLGMPQLPLVIAVLGYFTLFLAIELTLIHRQTSRREVSH